MSRARRFRARCHSPFCRALRAIACGGRLLAASARLIEKHKPDCLAIEKVFLAKNADSAFKLGHARGVIISVAASQRLPVHEYTTRHAKKMLTGSGAASKEQVQFLIENMLSIRAEKLDATDALALAICHAREAEIMHMLEQQGHSSQGV
ncbi:unnamed protein product [Sphagnum compactum]